MVKSSTGKEWAYDAVGNTTWHRETSGTTTTTGYDVQNRPSSQSSSANPGGWMQMFYDGTVEALARQYYGDNWRACIL